MESMNEPGVIRHLFNGASPYEKHDDVEERAASGHEGGIEE